MTWWLSYVLLQMGRVAEAEPPRHAVRPLGRRRGLARGRPAPGHARREGRAGRSRPSPDWRRSRRSRAARPLRPLILQALPLPRGHVGLGPGVREITARPHLPARATPPRGWPRPASWRRVAPRKPSPTCATRARPGPLTLPSPSPSPACCSAARALLPPARRNWVDVDAALAAAAKAAPNSPGVTVMQADRRILSGDMAGATARLEAATRSAPHDSETWVSFAALLERQGKPRGRPLRRLEVGRGAPGAAGDRVSRLRDRRGPRPHRELESRPRGPGPA